VASTKEDQTAPPTAEAGLWRELRAIALLLVAVCALPMLIGMMFAG
jgi:hypothetical protein